MNDSGCPGCFASVKGRQIEYENIKSKAAEYAKKNTTTVAICEEYGEYRFYEYEFARKSGFVIREVISQYS